MKTGQIADGDKFYGALFFSLIKMMFNGTAELGLTVSRLPVFFKQRDSLFYPAWAFALPIWLLQIPLSFVESLIWITLTYYTIRFAPDASRLCAWWVHRCKRCKEAELVEHEISQIGGLSDDLRPWMRWGYYISPMTYGQNAVAINEFLDDRWNTPNNDTRFSEPTVGKVLLKERSISCKKNAALGDSRSVISDDGKSKKKKRTQWSSASSAPMTEGIVMDARNTNNSSIEEAKKSGMVLPFQPLSLAFNHINYYVDMPAAWSSYSLSWCEWCWKEGRKTEGYIEVNINISGYPKNQSTFVALVVIVNKMTFILHNILGRILWPLN
ncbi:hypothetical protein P3S67_026497 [Capsicum chacoense]